MLLSLISRAARPAGWPVSQTHPRTTQCGARRAVSRVPHAQYKWATAAASAALEEQAAPHSAPKIERGREMKQWLINERRDREGGREREEESSLSHRWAPRGMWIFADI